MFVMVPHSWAQGDTLRRGISLTKAARQTEAEQAFRSIGPSDPDYISAQIHLGFLLLRRSALDEAEQAFRNVLDQQPEEAAARLGLGVVLVHKGKPASGAKEFEAILTDEVFGLKAESQWVMSLVYAGRAGEAFAEAKRLADHYLDNAEFQSLLGNLHTIRGETGNAVQAYLRSVELDPEELGTYFSLISLYRTQRDWKNALRWAQEALKLDDNQPQLYRELSIIYENLNRRTEAEVAQAEAGRTYDAEVLYIKAAQSRNAGRDAEAERLLRDCVSKNPRLAKAWVDIGELELQQNRLAEARLSFRSALETAPKDPRALLGLVTALQKDGREEDALRYLERAAGGGSLSPDLMTALASALQKQGKAQEAVAAAMKALEALPDDPDLLSYLGSLQLSIGDSRKAVDSYAAALRLNPVQVDALLGQAEAQLQQGATRGAIASLRRAQGLDPENVQVMKALVAAYRKAGDREAAESTCRACLKADSGDAECLEQLAWLRAAALDYKEAAALFQSMIDKGSESKSTLDGLSFSLMKTGSFQPAIEFSTRSLKKYGPDTRVYANLGYLHRCVGDIDAAVADYRRALALAPKDPDRNYDLGIAFYLARNYAGAVEPLETAIRIRPDWGMAHYHLALVHWNLGQIRLALAHARIARDRGVSDAKAVVRTLEGKAPVP
jgi:tetratricopeptide (TPR) repeat protein